MFVALPPQKKTKNPKLTCRNEASSSPVAFVLDPCIVGEGWFTLTMLLCIGAPLCPTQTKIAAGCVLVQVPFPRHPVGERVTWHPKQPFLLMDGIGETPIP